MCMTKPASDDLITPASSSPAVGGVTAALCPVPTVKDVYLNRAHAIGRNQAIIYQNIIVTRDPELDQSVAGACIGHMPASCMQPTVNI